MSTATGPSIVSIVQHAFVDSPSTLQYTLTRSNQKVSKLFVLKSSAYYNLQAYVALGKTLPASADGFETNFPKHDLKALIALDNQIYDLVKSTLVDVSKHCNNFESNIFKKFALLSSSVTVFCDDAADDIGGEDMLQDQVNILLDVSIDTTDNAYKLASGRAQEVLKVFTDAASTRQEECQTLLKELMTFKQQTTIDKSKVDLLYAKFISPGPPQGVKPYSETLQKEIAQFRLDAAKLAKDYQTKKEEYTHGVIAEGTAVTYAANTPFGTIAGGEKIGIDAQKAVDAKNVYEKHEKAFNVTLTKFINDVTHIATEATKIDNVVSDTINVLEKIEQTFRRLVSDFKAISEAINSSIGKDRNVDPFLQALAKVDLSTTLSKWDEVKTLALDHITHASIKWVGKL